MRTTFGLTLALGAVCALGQESTRPLQIRAAGIPLSSVLREASRQLGVKLEPGTLGDRPIIAKIEKMPAKEFLDQIARIVDAEWTRSGDTFILERGPSRVRIAEAREAESRTTWVIEAIDKDIARHPDANDWSDAAIDRRMREDERKRAELAERTKGESGVVFQVVDSNSLTPARMVLNEALKKIPPRVFAAIKPNERVVFATTPTRMQKALPYVSNTLSDYVRAYNRLANANRATPGEDPTGISVRTSLNQARTPIERIGKLLVIAERRGDGLNVYALIVDMRGEILDRPQTWLAQTDRPLGEAPAGTTGEVKLTDSSKAMVAALRPPGQSNRQFSFALSLGNGMTARLGHDLPRVPLTPALEKVFADPVAQDPQATFVAETFLGWAEARGKDLLAAVPDYAISPLTTRLAGGKVSVADLYRALPTLGLAIAEGEALVVSADNHARADRTRVNRAELGRLVAAYAKRGYASLDEICRYALAMPTWSTTNLDALWLGAYAPEAYDQYNVDQNEFLKLYGSLTPSQRLENQGRVIVPAMQMSAQQRAFIEGIVYKATGPMMIGNGQMIMATTTTGGPGRNAPQPPQESALMQTEPTEAFPNGLPPNTVLQLQRTRNEGVFAYESGNRGRFMSAGDLGLRLGFSSANMPGLNIQSNFSKFSLADLMTIEMTIQFGRRSKGSEGLVDGKIKDASIVAYDRLPDGFKQNVDRAKQRAQNMRTTTIGGGPVKPPL